MPNSNQIALNQVVPDFSFNATNHLSANLKDYRGKNVVLYFYPKDNTPGCTSESKAFRDYYEKFQNYNCVIFGISRDTLASHEKFKQKLELPFELISDADSTLCELFSVQRTKLLFGKSFLGIIRSTFLINQQGVLQQMWRNVRVKGHVEAVYEAIRATY